MDENRVSQAFECIAKLNLSRLETATLAYRLAGSVGDYDGFQPGSIAEIYAEEQLGMTRAPRGQKAYDGKLPNGRKLSVKSKKFGRGTYVEISPSLWDEFDDLLVIFIDQHGALRRIIGPFAFSEVRDRGYHNQRNRFRISDMADWEVTPPSD